MSDLFLYVTAALAMLLAAPLVGLGVAVARLHVRWVRALNEPDPLDFWLSAFMCLFCAGGATGLILLAVAALWGALS